MVQPRAAKIFADDLSFAEAQTGSLEVGKCADLVVLEKDLFELASEQIGEVKVLRTLLAGKVVYRGPMGLGTLLALAAQAARCRWG